MADNFNMKKYLAENKLGAYSRLKEDIGGDIGDAEAMKQMDFLAEYEVIYVYGEDGKCYRKDDENNMDEVNMSYCRRYAEGKEEKEEGYMGTQYDSSEDMAVDMIKKGLPEEKVEEADQGNLMIISRVEEIVNNLARNISTNSNIPTQEKIGLVQALKELKDLVEDLGADIEQEYEEKEADSFYDEDEPVSDYSRRRAGLSESDNPEGDQLVVRFLKGIAKKFDYPVGQAALFVKERLKKLGY
jgi:hypothetical protein